MIARQNTSGNPDGPQVLKASGLSAYAEDYGYWPRQKRIVVEAKAADMHLCELLARVEQKRSGWRIEVREWKGGEA